MLDFENDAAGFHTLALKERTVGDSVKVRLVDRCLTALTIKEDGNDNLAEVGIIKGGFTLIFWLRYDSHMFSLSHSGTSKAVNWGPVSWG